MMPARIALSTFHMAAESGRTAVADRFESFSLMGTKYVSPSREELFFVSAEDIGYFEPMFSIVPLAWCFASGPGQACPAFPAGFWWSARRCRRGGDSRP